MKIALAQLSTQIGDIDNNTQKIIQYIQKAKQQHVQLIVFSECSISGYPLLQAFYNTQLVQECEKAMELIADECDTITAIIGSPHFANNIFYNSVYVLQHKKIDALYSDICCNDTNTQNIHAFNCSTTQKPLAIIIGSLTDSSAKEIIRTHNNYSAVIHIAAIPYIYTHNSLEPYIQLSKQCTIPIAIANHAGAQSDTVFAGKSSVFFQGTTIMQLPDFEESFGECNLFAETDFLHSAPTQDIELLYKALITGVKEFFRKNKFTKAIIGLSGGIDSAVVLAIVADALGSSNIHCLCMPTEYTSAQSVLDARELIQNIGCPHHSIPLDSLYSSTLQALSPIFNNTPLDSTEENIQARLRGLLLMAMSNKYGHILLNTSNKSEVAVGYSTMYGDMNGSLSVLGDVYKTDVYALARYINSTQEIIPESIITKAPSAELRPDQKDSDSLPDYSTLDPFLHAYIEQKLSAQELISQGYDTHFTHSIISLIHRAEYKRYQMPPILRVSKHSFGRDRNMPLISTLKTHL